ncbi:MAG TPA: tripartite tricarboxylate transporter substrate binding protein [Burkholderiales bacterium]
MKLRALVLPFVFFAAAACAQQYPSRPIRILVPIPPGGAPDIAARVIGEKLQQQMGQPVVVENKPGSNGNIAGEALARAAPDGYTIGLIADSQVVINPHLYKSMPFDPLRDLLPIATIVEHEFVLTINPSLPAKTFPEFIEYARNANPPLNYASGGNGSQHHLMMEELKQRAGINMVHVPYRGGSPATAATVAGETAAMWAGSSNAAQIKSGRLRAIAVSSAKRSTEHPDLPSIAEFYPGYDNRIWLGMFGPAGLPEPVLERLRAELRKALESPDAKQRLARAGGLEPFITTPEEFNALIKREYEKYGKVVKDLGLKVD